MRWCWRGQPGGGQVVDGVEMRDSEEMAVSCLSGENLGDERGERDCEKETRMELRAMHERRRRNIPVGAGNALKLGCADNSRPKAADL